jgi:hypothetical protein
MRALARVVSVTCVCRVDTGVEGGGVYVCLGLGASWVRAAVGHAVFEGCERVSARSYEQANGKGSGALLSAEMTADMGAPHLYE